jgi:predicted Rossmann-fold nucleotide-binding protein
MDDDKHDRSKIVCAGREHYTAHIQAFMHQHGLHKIIAFSGGADDSLEGIPDAALQHSYKRAMQQKEEYIVEQAMRKLRGYRIAILCGGTTWGLPQTAALKAKQYGFTTIGVYPYIGLRHVLDSELLDLSVCVEPLYGESYWGDESPIFTQLLDGVIVYGGSAGTLVEMAHILKMNEVILKKGGMPKYIVPIAGTGGVADGLPFIWSKTEIRNKSLPTHRITNGVEAADVLIEKLLLTDYLD